MGWDDEMGEEDTDRKAGRGSIYTGGRRGRVGGCVGPEAGAVGALSCARAGVEEAGNRTESS